jgi:hypothetical protein
VRRYLEKKAAAKAKQEEDGTNEPPVDSTDRRSELVKRGSARFGKSRDQVLDDSCHAKEAAEEKSEARRGFFAKRRHNGSDARRKAGSNAEATTSEDDSLRASRPAFESALHGQSTSSKKLQPRAVAIPYSRLKKERFYDWPPDPTVSRATPMIIYPKSVDDSLSTSVPSVLHEEEQGETARPESSDSVPFDIPEYVTFPSNFMQVN